MLVRVNFVDRALTDTPNSMGEAKPQIIIIAGPNGAGKTTLAPFLLRDKLGLLEYVNADQIALGLSAFDPAGVAVGAGRVMMHRLRELAEQRKTFAFETTLAARLFAAWIEELGSARLQLPVDLSLAKEPRTSSSSRS